MTGNVADHVACPFSGHDGANVNVKFFRGNRSDIITADEILEQARSAAMQLKMGTAARSKAAPVSSHTKVNVRDFVATLQY